MDKSITFKYVLAVLGAVLFTWLVHEFAHWLTSELYGYETIMRLNGTSTVEGENPTDIQENVISAAGPIITVLQAILAFLLLKAKGWNKYLYPVLFIAFYMRLLAGLVNIVNPNDEGRISEFLGIGTFTLSIIVSAFLFFLVYKISKMYKLSWKFQLATTLLVMMFTTMVILGDQIFELQLI